MQETIGAMREIQTASRQIAEIVSLIDSIAFFHLSDEGEESASHDSTDHQGDAVFF